MTNLHGGQIEHKKMNITNPAKGHWPQQIWEKYKIYKFLLFLSSSQNGVIALMNCTPLRKSKLKGLKNCTPQRKSKGGEIS